MVREVHTSKNFSSSIFDAEKVLTQALDLAAVSGTEGPLGWGGLLGLPRPGFPCHLLLLERGLEAPPRPKPPSNFIAGGRHPFLSQTPLLQEDTSHHPAL